MKANSDLVSNWLKDNKPTQVKKKVSVMSDEQKEFRKYIREISSSINKWTLGRKALKGFKGIEKLKAKKYMAQKFGTKKRKAIIFQMSNSDLLNSKMKSLI